MPVRSRLGDNLSPTDTAHIYTECSTSRLFNVTVPASFQVVGAAVNT